MPILEYEIRLPIRQQGLQADTIRFLCFCSRTKKNTNTFSVASNISYGNVIDVMIHKEVGRNKMRVQKYYLLILTEI